MGFLILFISSSDDVENIEVLWRCQAGSKPPKLAAFINPKNPVQLERSVSSMKKASTSKQADELRPEYDLSKLKGGVRGKYYVQARPEPILS